MYFHGVCRLGGGEGEVEVEVKCIEEKLCIKFTLKNTMSTEINCPKFQFLGYGNRSVQQTNASFILKST